MWFRSPSWPRNVTLGILLGALLTVSLFQEGHAQGPDSGWSRPELLFSSSQKSNELWLLRDQADILYLWWPVFFAEEDVEDEGAVFHTQWLDGQWQEPIDVLLWPDAGRLTSVTIDATGTLHAFSPTDCVSYVRTSHDQAMSAQAWHKRSCLDSSGNSNLMVAHDSDGTIYVVYVTSESQTLRVLRSKDNGATWSSPSTVAEIYDGYFSDPALAIDEQGRLHLAWTRLPPETYPPQGVLYARSDDAGENWTAPMQLGQEDEGQPAIAVRGDEVHVLWNGDAAKRGRYYRYSWDAGNSWMPVLALSPQSAPGGLQRPPAIIIDDVGHVHALLHEQESLYYVKKNESSWTVKEPLYMPDHMRASEIFAVRLAITGGDQLHAVYTLRSYIRDKTIKDRDNFAYSIYHQYRLIEAQPDTPVPWPTSTTVATSHSTMPTEPLTLPTPKPQRNEEYGADNSAHPLTSNPAFPTFVGMGGVLMLIAGVMLTFIVQTRR